MRLFYRTLAKITGKNPNALPADDIVDQMTEPRPLPLGRKEFEEWSSRIVAGALLPTGHLKPEEIPVYEEGQKFALANMLMHIGPTESHKPDAHFIHALRVAAIKQVAHPIIQELHKAAKDRTAAEEAAKAANEADQG